MIKTLDELADKLNELYPTRYSHFNSKQEGTFIVYLDQGEDNFHADNKVLTEITLVDIELYSPEKNLVAERQIKDLFRANNIQYDKLATTYIEDEKIFLTTFAIELVNDYKTMEELNNG